MPPLAFSQADPDRAAKEARLRAMSKEELMALYRETRRAAGLAHWAKDKETLHPLIRGMKVLQHIADEKGFFIRTRRLQPAIIVRQSRPKPT